MPSAAPHRAPRRTPPPRSAWLAVLCLLAGVSAVRAQGDAASPPAVLLNEVDADQHHRDVTEFVELVTHAPRQSLQGWFLLLYDGRDLDAGPYGVIDLHEHESDDRGLFVVGSVRVQGVHLVAFGPDGLRNDDAAVALYDAPGLLPQHFADARAASPPPGARLVDVLVYGTPRGAALGAAFGFAAGLHEGDDRQPGTGSLQRVPDGGLPRDGSAWIAGDPSPGELNGRPTTAAIHDIQGAAHLSPMRGRVVRGVEGIVTASLRGSFMLQTVPGSEDGDPATSEAVTVVTGHHASPDVGDRVRVTGRVEEHLPGGVDSNLTTTRILMRETFVLVGRGVALPPAVLVGADGVRPPRGIFDDDTEDGVVGLGTTTFDPLWDGLDFWESLEAMRVRLDGARAVDHRSSYGELVVAPAGSALTASGLLIAREDDFHPERLLVDDPLVATPDIDGGDGFDGPLVGVLDYGFGNFRLLLTEPVGRVPGNVAATPVLAADPSVLTAATYNVLNLSARAEAERFTETARRIVHDLRSPMLVALQEIQDDSGPTNDGTTGADATLGRLVEAIAAEGGPPYRAIHIAPEDGADGGQPGANIRVALLARTDGDVRFSPRPAPAGGTGLSPVPALDGGPQLAGNPVRVDPQHSAWRQSRKPLAASFTWQGRNLFVIVVHLSSRGGDDPLSGAFQPPRRPTEAERQAQSDVLADFTARILDADPEALVMVLGDFNEFTWGAPLASLAARTGLVDLVTRVPEDERYTYVFQGNAQVLDHILVSPALERAVRAVHIVHRDAHRQAGASDHDPVWAAFAPPR